MKNEETKFYEKLEKTKMKLAGKVLSKGVLETFIGATDDEKYLMFKSVVDALDKANLKIDGNFDCDERDVFDLIESKEQCVAVALYPDIFEDDDNE